MRHSHITSKQFHTWKQVVKILVLEEQPQIANDGGDETKCETRLHRYKACSGRNGHETNDRTRECTDLSDEIEKNAIAVAPGRVTKIDEFTIILNSLTRIIQQMVCLSRSSRRPGS